MIFICICIRMHARCVNVMCMDNSRGQQIPCKSHNMGARNQIQVLWKAAGALTTEPAVRAPSSFNAGCDAVLELEWGTVSIPASVLTLNESRRFSYLQLNGFLVFIFGGF